MSNVPTWIELYTQRSKLRKQNKIMRAALTDLASEACTYTMHGIDMPEPNGPADYDPECPGEVCTAKKALRDARAVR